MKKLTYNAAVYFIDDYNFGGRLRVLKGKVTGIYHSLPDKLTYVVEGSGACVYREADALYTTIDELKEAIDESIVEK